MSNSECVIGLGCSSSIISTDYDEATNEVVMQRVVTWQNGVVETSEFRLLPGESYVLMQELKRNLRYHRDAAAITWKGERAEV